ncbi:L-2-hydroxyglutarate oxidase [Actinomarinicola tropica]|uniref:L-2-hydroxyglutarate oxidase n=1 Tax=Actinomarinicola tropica TaxID=2789776 RepID=A0A5Q2RQE3_9ACTN|nr:L-2-hydroxyglutarate oxidase [Actinomarinicola tropica]QGG96357.1 L-2-hydroxyglutarate oxidase [Actinomarinicola tropica]
MPTPPLDADVLVVGAGIVGLATARALQHAEPARRVVVVDKEPDVAWHQTGRNSGVVHSGVYYRPGSLKARLVAEGRAELRDLCRDRGLPFVACGKLVVATRRQELDALDEIERRAEANGVAVERLGPEGIREVEPHAAGLAALRVPSAAVVDFGAVARALADDVRADGEVRLGAAVDALRPTSAAVEVDVGDTTLRAGQVVNCAGLHADVLARRAGHRSDVRIVPFRGEYHELAPHRRELVRALIYPVPDPRFPFLGVHLTRMVDGSVHVGPNAVLALAREGYRWRDVDLREVRELAASPALRGLARRHWRTGAGEVARSASRQLVARTVRRLVPGVGADDLVRAGAGVRAQACRPDGTLVDDFVVERSGRIVHVLNAPSPAATASLAIGRHVAGLVDPHS